MARRFGTLRGRRRRSMPAEVGASTEKNSRLKAMMSPSPTDFWSVVDDSHGTAGKAPSKSAPASPKSKSVAVSPSPQEFSKTFIFKDIKDEEREESVIKDEEKEGSSLKDEEKEGALKEEEKEGSSLKDEEKEGVIKNEEKEESSLKDEEK